MQTENRTTGLGIVIATIIVCSLACTTLSVLGVGILYLTSVFGDEGERTEQTFDRETWLAWHNNWDQDNPRFGMAEEVRAWLLTERPTEAQVLERLGPPDAGQRDTVLAYNLGVPLFSIDYYALEIYFGHDGRVSELHQKQG